MASTALLVSGAVTVSFGALVVGVEWFRLRRSTDPERRVLDAESYRATFDED